MRTVTGRIRAGAHQSFVASAPVLPWKINDTKIGLIISAGHDAKVLQSEFNGL